VLVAVAKLDARKKNRSVCRVGRIPFYRLECSIERLVIGDIDGVKSRASMPFSASFGGEPGTAVVRSFGMTMKIDSDQVAIAELERCHRTRSDEHDAQHRDRASRESGGRARASRDAQAPECSEMSKASRSSKAGCADRKRSPVLSGRE